MSLTILRAVWKKLFKKNKRNKYVEESEKSERFKEIKAKIDEVEEIQSNRGWELTKEEQKIQEDFQVELFKFMTKKELPEKSQITTLGPRNESEALKMLKRIKEKFPEVMKTFFINNSATAAKPSEKANTVNDIIRKNFEKIKETQNMMDTILKEEIKDKAEERLEIFEKLEKMNQEIKEIKEVLVELRAQSKKEAYIKVKNSRKLPNKTLQGLYKELKENGAISDELKESLIKRAIPRYNIKSLDIAREILNEFKVFDSYPEIVKRLRERETKLKSKK